MLGAGAGGCIMLFAGYFLMQLVVRHVIPSDYRLMGVFALLMGQGSSWMYTVALNTNLYNFRDEDRGKIVGILVCMVHVAAFVGLAAQVGLVCAVPIRSTLLARLTMGSPLLMRRHAVLSLGCARGFSASTTAACSLRR